MNIERLSRFATTTWVIMLAKHPKRLNTIVIVGCLLLSWLYGLRVWNAYASRPELFTPFFTPIAALLVGLVALGQLQVARKRHDIESFSKAVEQLGSDKSEVRLGGIYALERISKESPADYWTVMENLTAFVREHSQRNEAERVSQDAEQRIAQRAYLLWQEAGRPDGRDKEFWDQAVLQDKIGNKPAMDIAAILTIIKQQSERNRMREFANNWCLDLRGAILKNSNLSGAHLEWVNLSGAHLEGADLSAAYLDDADLSGAYMRGALIWFTHLTRANLGQHDTHLQKGGIRAFSR